MSAMVKENATVTKEEFDQLKSQVATLIHKLDQVTAERDKWKAKAAGKKKKIAVDPDVYFRHCHSWDDPAEDYKLWMLTTEESRKGLVRLDMTNEHYEPVSLEMGRTIASLKQRVSYLHRVYREQKRHAEMFARAKKERI